MDIGYVTGKWNYIDGQMPPVVCNMYQHRRNSMNKLQWVLGVLLSVAFILIYGLEGMASAATISVKQLGQSDAEQQAPLVRVP